MKNISDSQICWQLAAGQTSLPTGVKMVCWPARHQRLHFEDNDAILMHSGKPPSPKAQGCETKFL
jgi:hypothetical protein